MGRGSPGPRRRVGAPLSISKAVAGINAVVEGIDKKLDALAGRVDSIQAALTKAKNPM